MHTVSEIYILLENIPGTFSNLTRLLKKKNISINAIGLFVDSARIYVTHAEKALKLLQDNGYHAEMREVLGIILPNKSGTLMEVATKISNAGININYLYGAMMEKQKEGLIILEVDQPQLALDIFENHRF